MRRSGAAPGLALVSLALALAGSVAGAQADSALGGARPPGGVAPLFANDSVLSLTLTANLRALYRDRDSTRAKAHAATLAWRDGDSTIVVPATLKTRGHFRRRTTTCAVPPLRLSVPRKQSAGTMFEGQSALKLVTHCQPRDEYEQNVLQEYLLYRVVNLFTPRSFRARLVRIEYVDSARAGAQETRYGILLENEKGMARRNGATLIEQTGAQVEDVDAAQTDLVGVLEYLFGNTDFSIWGLHNIRLIRDDRSLTVYPVPYDFDWSGLIAARYAKPSVQLRIQSVKQRLYRAPCRPAGGINPTLEAVRARRAEIRSLFANQAGLTPERREDADKYLEEFFRTIDDPKRLKSQMLDHCLEHLP